MTTHILARISVFGVLLAVVGALLASGLSVRAAVITVNSTADDLTVNGNCTLREAIQSANTDSAVDACAAGSGDDVIDLPAGTYTITIVGSGEDANATGDFDILTNLAINGAAAGTTIVDGGQLDRVFDISTNNGPTTTTIAGLTVRNGGANGDEDGGGIQSDYTLTLSGVIVTENDGDDGGGIENDGTLTINDSTISNNTADEGDEGGGIWNSGDLTVNRSTFSGNTSDDNGGGAISNEGGLAELNNTTVSGNTTVGAGGGILNDGGSTLLLNNSTIAGNSADGGGGGIAAEDIINKSASIQVHDTYVSAGIGTSGAFGFALLGGSAIDLANTIVANNPTGGDCEVETGSFQSNNSLDSDGTCGLAGPGDKSAVDPQLAALANNGGPTETRAIPATSPATDAGDPETCLTEDQRGITRPQDGNNDGTSVCDIGAYELQPATPAPSGTPTLAPATASPAALPPTGASGDSGGSSMPWLVLAGLATLGAIGGFFMVRRRMGATTS